MNAPSFHLVVDGRTCRTGATGVGNWVAGLLRGLDTTLFLDPILREFVRVSVFHLPEPGGPLDWRRLRCIQHFSDGVKDYESHPAGDIWLQMGINRLMRKIGGDVLLSPAFLCPLGPRTFKRILGVLDTIAWRQPWNYPPAFATYLRTMASLGSRSAECIISISPPACREVKRCLGVPRVRILPCGFDPHRFYEPPPEEKRETRQRLGFRDGERVLLYVASREPRKNHEMLIEAFRCAREKQPDLRLYLLGSVSAGEATPGVRWLRGREHDVAAFTRAADLVVFPSRAEGFGLPVLEALACGTPVVASNIPALRWLTLGGRCARLVGAVDPKGWAEAMLTPPHPAMAVRGLHRASALTWERSARKLLRIARSLATR